MKINLISLGCAKNLIDSEVIAGILNKKGYTLTYDVYDTDVIILNTCSFIGRARMESKRYINSISKIIKTYEVKTSINKKPIFIVTGCLPQLEKEKLFTQYPEIDAVVGSSDFIKTPKIIRELTGKHRSCPTRRNKITQISKPGFIYNKSYPRLVSTGKSYAYIKIAEGCDNRCNYCLIPALRGSYRERKIEDIVSEAKRITDAGIKELILVSQDTTFYGTKQYGKRILPKLIRKLAEISDLRWIRILYAHPAHFTNELSHTIAEVDKVCKYIDIPIQHTHDEILTRMGRPPSKLIFDTIEKLRKQVSNITLRTTVMVGFPGETEKHFSKLLRDIRTLEFDSLGCFTYSRQKETKAYEMNGQVPLEIRKHRFHRIMSIQQKTVLKKNKQRIGKVYDVLVDADNYGHTEFQAPEVDGKVLLDKNTKPGMFIKTRICGFNKVYDLVGSIKGA